MWLHFSDGEGDGWAAPDLVVPGERLVVECKRTYTQEADAQLLLVYRPLLEHLWPGDWRLVVAARYWSGLERELIFGLNEAQVGLNYYLRRW